MDNSTTSKLTQEQQEFANLLDSYSEDINFDSNLGTVTITSSSLNSSNTANAIYGGPALSSSSTTSNSNINLGGYYNNNTYTTTGGYYTQGWNYSTDFQLESSELAINIEKLFTYPEEKRDFLKELIRNFINESDHSIKKMLLNTLESYSLIVDKKMLERKVKISNTINEDNEEEK